MSADLLHWKDFGPMDWGENPKTPIEGGTVMFVYDGGYAIVYNLSSGLVERGIYYRALRGAKGQPVETAGSFRVESGQNTTVQVLEQNVPAGGDKGTIWLDVQDASRLYLTYRWSAPTKHSVNVFWSNDGVTSHGRGECCYGFNVGLSATSYLADVKAPFVRFSFRNKDESAADLKCWQDTALSSNNERGAARLRQETVYNHMAVR